MSGDNAEDVPKCAVCGDTASGVHFSVMVCRACAAFYRRSTISNRRYICRFDGNCEIGKDVRCCCRACRLKKCEDLGMKANAVQRHRDRIGPRKRPPSSGHAPTSEVEAGSSPFQPNSSESVISPNSSTTDGFRPNAVHLDQEGRSFAQLTPCPPSSSSIWTNRMTAESANQLEQSAAELPLISEMMRGYKKALALQRTARNLNETTNFNRLFDDCVTPTFGTYHEDIAAIHAAVPIVSEMINSHFRPLEKFETPVKWTLLRQFFCQFIIVKRSYLSAQHFPELDDPRCMISPDHYTSLEELHKFFEVENCKVEPSRMASIFKPTLTRINAMITNPLRKLRLSESEFVGLLGLLFWSDTLSNLEANEARLVVDTQRAIVNELYSLTKQRAGPNPLDVSVRFGILCNLVPLVSRFANEIAANFSLANMSNSFNVDNFIHELIPQTF